MNQSDPEMVGEVNPLVFERVARQSQAEQLEATPEGIISAKDRGLEFTAFAHRLDPTTDPMWNVSGVNVVRPGPAQINAALCYMTETVKNPKVSSEYRFEAAKYILDMEMKFRD